jgi:hypothetical protein
LFLDVFIHFFCFYAFTDASIWHHVMWDVTSFMLPDCLFATILILHQDRRKWRKQISYNLFLVYDLAKLVPEFNEERF